MKTKNLVLFFGVFFALFPFLTLAEKEDLLILFAPKEKLERDAKIKINDQDFELSAKEIESWTKEETRLEYAKNYRSEIENIRICSKEKSIICHLSLPQKKTEKIKKISVFRISRDLARDYVETLAVKTEKAPEGAKFKMEDGRVSVFSLGEDGGKLDEEKSLEIIVSYLEGGNFPDILELPWEKISPDVSSNSIDNMGIDTLIGQGKSNFRGSPKNRIYNIKVAVEKFNGILVAPDEEFSFVGILGEVDGEHGYLPELVIKKDKTEPEFGGGICQVSTTVFRAAINSGLEITARRNHAYPVQYYNPQGMDATVYVPRPDLRFKNNTPGYILIQPKIEGTELIFDFYGTSDGRKVEIDGPKIVERRTDGGMRATFTQKVYDKNGEIMIEEIFNSNYDSPAKYPHPGTTDDILTQKPKDWSEREWKKYKKAHNL